MGREGFSPSAWVAGGKRERDYMPKAEGLNKFGTEILDFKRPQNCFIFVMSTQLTFLSILLIKYVHET